MHPKRLRPTPNRRRALPCEADPDPIATYGAVAVRAAFTRWWCTKQYEAIVTWGDRLDSSALDSEPLLRLYLECARHAAGGAGSPANG